MRKILEKEFLSRRISKLLTTTIAKNEFSSTFVSKHLAPHQNQQNSAKTVSGKEEHKNLDSGQTLENESQSSVIVSKHKIVINKEAAKKKKRIEVVS